MCIMEARREIEALKHHEQKEICPSRANYRQGRKDTAVKVYTVNQESRYLLAHGVPAVGCAEELEDLCGQFGALEDVKALDEYPAEKFTEVHCVKYCHLRDARFAKRKLDNRSFFGGVLHVCYAPELESVNETREKLTERRRIIAAKTGQRAPPELFVRQRESTSTDDNAIVQPTEPEMITYVWAGKTYTVPASNSSSSANTEKLSTATQSASERRRPQSASTNSLIPRQLQNKRKNAGTVSEASTSSVDPSSSYIQNVMNKTAEPTRLVTWKRKKTV